jgi:phage tail-like protein
MSEQSPIPSAYAIPAFRFVVDVARVRQAVFTECTLPVIEWETEELKEGGINTSTRLLPGRRRSAKLTLKNGVGNPELMGWYLDTLSGMFFRRSVTISLLDFACDANGTERKVIAVWNIEDAFPVQWTGPELRSGENTIAIQTLQLACGEIKVEIPRLKKDPPAGTAERSS